MSSTTTANERVQVLCRQLTQANDRRGNEPPRASLLPTRAEYERMYKASIDDPATFWAGMAGAYHFQTPWVKAHHSFNFDMDKGPVHVEFFKGSTTNVCYNALDRWCERGRGTQACFLWEGNEPSQQRSMSYQQVLDEVCRTANWLKAQGVKAGDVITVYLPMICELPIIMLACARIGAVHSVVFAGFSAESLAQRVQDCSSFLVVTASGTARGAKRLDLKAIVDAALDICAKAQHHVRRVLVVEDQGQSKAQTQHLMGRDVWWDESVARCSSICPVEWMDAEAPLFLLYTSGSTGTPKGVLHTTGGYMVGAGTTIQYLYDMQPGDIWWCTADCGWITGHTYITYGPLLSGATVVLFGGVPTYPNAGRCWEIVEKYKVRGLLTAPTLIRSLMPAGEQHVRRHDRTSLRVLGLVGEPINAEAWNWYHKVVGEGRCPILDNWWQTETGAVMLSPFTGAWCKPPPGCAMLPFFGVHTMVLDAVSGKELFGETDGVLALRAPNPSMARTLFRNHKRFEEAYFSQYKGVYFTGDGCRRDADGSIWITGRVDDVLNVSGHRIGTAEVENALCSHKDIAEAGVVGLDHPVKGQSIYAYVVPMPGVQTGKALRAALVAQLRSAIGPHAAPDAIHWAPSGLPKTRSGKVMRRVLRKVASGEEKELGDLSTLADPTVVTSLVASRGQE